MSFFIKVNHVKVEYFSLNEVAEYAGVSRSCIVRQLEYIRLLIDDDLFETLTYIGRDPKVKPKKKTLYVSSQMKDLLILYAQHEQKKKEYYNSLPDNRFQLKSALTRLQFLDENEKLAIDCNQLDLSNEQYIHEALQQQCNMNESDLHEKGIISIHMN